MKLKLLTICAIVGITFAACNSNSKTENLEDSALIDTVMRVDSVIVDTTAVQDTTIADPM